MILCDALSLQILIYILYWKDRLDVTFGVGCDNTTESPKITFGNVGVLASMQSQVVFVEYCILLFVIWFLSFFKR